MKYFGRILFGLFLALIIIELVLIFPQNEGVEKRSEGPKEDVVAQVPPNSDQVLKGVHLVETREGRREWELGANDATSFQEAGEWILNRVKVRFFDEGGKQTFEVEGNKGTVVPKSKDLRISGDVVVYSAIGYRLKTDNVLYNSAKKILTSEDPLEMVDTTERPGRRLTLTGKGFEGSVDQGIIDVLSDVAVRKGLEDGRVANVRSQRARFTGKDRSANFSGEVGIDMGTSRITGPEARFIYDGNKKKITSLEVDGGVRLTDLDKWGTGRRLTVSFVKDKYVLSGSPKVVQNDDEIFGEKITILNGGKKILVEQGRAEMEPRKERGRPW